MLFGFEIRSPDIIIIILLQ